jgi:CRISPR-associated protein Csx10
MQVEGLMSKEDAVKAIRKYQTPQDIPSCKQQSSSPVLSQSASGSEWRKIQYSLELRTPVAIVTNTLGNVSETLDFIPGTYLLPHITWQLTGISKYVAAGDFQVSPATIEINQARGLPVPKVFLQEKLNESNVCNRLESPEELFKGKPFKPLREGFVTVENGDFTHVKTPIILLMHNTVKDEIQRPDETVGGVFSRQAIKAGTTLRGEIRFKKSIEGEVKSLENHTSNVRLGTSKKDDYGLAKLTLEELEDDKSSVAPAKELTVYFESDVLLRNTNLRQTNLVEALKAELEKSLGQGTLKSADEVIAEAEERLEKNPEDEESKKIVEEKKGKDSLIQVRRIESWHEGWGLPRPTLTAMAAGSVVVFDVVGTIDPSTLQHLELSGIGERRGEGYGRIRFNPPLLMNPNSWFVSPKTKPATNGSSEAREKLKAEIHNAEKLYEFVSIIERSAWRDELARAVLKLANDKDQRKKIFGFDSDDKIPSMSQIGGLRSAFRRIEKPKDKNVVGWLEHMEETSNRLEKWGKNNNKDEAKKKLEAIKKLISDESEVWKTLRQTDSNGRSYLNLPTEFVTPHKDIKTDLWAEAVKSLFDACARAHKRDTEDDHNG